MKLKNMRNLAAKDVKQDFGGSGAGGLKEQMMANPEFSRIQEAIKSDSEKAIEAVQELGTQAKYAGKAALKALA